MLHHALVSPAAVSAWVAASPRVALYAFMLEISFSVVDAVWMWPLDPETLVHHSVSPMCASDYFFPARRTFSTSSSQLIGVTFYSLTARETLTEMRRL